MTRYLNLNEVLQLHRRVMQQSGGAIGLHNLSGLEAALAQPRMTFGGEELYPSIIEKAAALGFSLIQNHPFVDGNKRTGHAAMEVFLILNGFELEASVDKQEQVILQVAAGAMKREEFTEWVRDSVVVEKNNFSESASADFSCQP